MNRFKRYVMVMARFEDRDEVHFVTGCDKIREFVYWKNGEFAVPFHEAEAKMLVTRLRANGFQASIVTLPDTNYPPLNRDTYEHAI